MSSTPTLRHAFNIVALRAKDASKPIETARASSLVVSPQQCHIIITSPGAYAFATYLLRNGRRGWIIIYGRTVIAASFFANLLHRARALRVRVSRKRSRRSRAGARLRVYAR